MEEQEYNRSFFIGVTTGAFIGGCLAALMSMRNTFKESEYTMERGLELKGHTEDIVRGAQQVAGESIARVQANSEISQISLTTTNDTTG
ncbi:MAG: hypothetical protein AAGF95_04560 [Chloroflexota bacterium]